MYVVIVVLDRRDRTVAGQTILIRDGWTDRLPRTMTEQRQISFEKHQERGLVRRI